MQFCQHFQILSNVIFLLSTIVTVTDCCSSRILLLREHTLKIVERNFHNHLHEHAHELQQQIEHHVVNLVTQMEHNKTLQQQQQAPEDLTPTGMSEVPTTTSDPSDDMSLPGIDRPPPLTTTSPEVNTATFNVETTTSVARNVSEVPDGSFASSGTPKINMSDMYLNIMRDVLSLECSGQYLTDFCLNGGRCFRYPVGNHSFFSCECADGYIGERCESKSLNELYVRTPALDAAKPKVLMARIVFSFPMLILLSTIYMLFGAFFVFRNPQTTQNILNYRSRVGFFAS